MGRDHSAPQYVVFSTPLQPLPPQSHICPSTPYSQTSSPTFLPQCEPHGFIPTEKSRRKHNSVYEYEYLYFFKQSEDKISVLNDNKLSLTSIYSELLPEGDFDSSVLFPYTELFHHFKGLMISPAF